MANLALTSIFAVERYKLSKELTNLWALAKLCGLHLLKAQNNILFLSGGRLGQESLVWSTVLTGLVHCMQLEHRIMSHNLRNQNIS